MPARWECGKSEAEIRPAQFFHVWPRPSAAPSTNSMAGGRTAREKAPLEGRGVGGESNQCFTLANHLDRFEQSQRGIDLGTPAHTFADRVQGSRQREKEKK